MHIIIPARYASSRLPGKALADIAGKPLIQRVHERAKESGVGLVTIATDDARIAHVARNFGATVCLTATTHQSGTDRVGEVVGKLGLKPDEIVINLQGDEPLMPPTLIAEVGARLAADGDAAMATACCAIADRDEFENPNVVKVVCDCNDRALYFSRAPIPWPRTLAAAQKSSAASAFRHIGIYAYRAEFITRFCAWGACALEQVEQLEQLRALWHGERIAVVRTTETSGPGVDTPQDLEQVISHFKK